MKLPAQLVAEGYAPHDVERAMNYVGLVLHLIEKDRAYAAPMKRGVRVLAKKLDSRQGADHFKVTVAEMCESMDPIPDADIQEFIAITGEFMFVTADGPMGSTPSLCGAIDAAVEVWQGAL